MAQPNTPTVTSAGDALRMEQQVLTASGFLAEAPDVASAFDRAAALIDEFQKAIVADEATGEYSAAGLVAQRTRRGIRLVDTAKELEARATEIERQQDETFDSAWAQLELPARDVLDYMKLADLRARIDRLDPLMREQILLAAARTGEHNDLLRAVIAMPKCPEGYEEWWPGQLTANFVNKLKDAVRDRVTPMGLAYWRSAQLRTIARYLRQAVRPDLGQAADGNLEERLVAQYGSGTV